MRIFLIRCSLTHKKVGSGCLAHPFDNLRHKVNVYQASEHKKLNNIVIMTNFHSF